ncbi:hypothetical protein NDU88_004064 [Pleurodeles waltl]|uniref:Uncharacterized protein n=1 Tax=Pleurodeles waltl TaxID=8319 RepID=A0AAV7SHQ1_PLEWA|nr:hypothetical protein NDU88_004064 [Pleurodeles waltl]
MGGAATGETRPVPLLQGDLPGSAHDSCAPGEDRSPVAHHVGPTRTRAPAPGHEEPGAARTANMQAPRWAQATAGRAPVTLRIGNSSGPSASGADAAPRRHLNRRLHPSKGEPGHL